MRAIDAVKGMNDFLPEQTIYWQEFEKLLLDLTKAYGYQEIRTPIVEKTELFLRTIGDVTDIVEKEMYTFLDRNQLSLSLRPEGTAGCVRAAIENQLLYNQTQRLWYLGPLFRYEQPQKGRYRQFHQFGVEALGFAGPDIDIEILSLSASLMKRLGLFKDVALQINTLGTREMRERYKNALVNYFTKHHDLLDEDSRRRLTSNPLRILDSKNKAMHPLITNAPSLLDYIEGESLANFHAIQDALNQLKIPFEVNSRLVRGLDYYTDLVFEWVTPYLGAQATVCAGGRYDQLIGELGGESTPAIGFAAGCERLIELMQERLPQSLNFSADIYMIIAGEQAMQKGVILADLWRQELPGISLICHCGQASFKSQFKKADKSGARIALVLGDDEAEKGLITIKFLRETQEQKMLPFAEVAVYLKQYFAK